MVLVTSPISSSLPWSEQFLSLPRCLSAPSGEDTHRLSGPEQAPVGELAQSCGESGGVKGSLARIQHPVHPELAGGPGKLISSPIFWGPRTQLHLGGYCPLENGSFRPT